MKNKKFSFARLSKGALVALICILAVVIILAGALVGAFFALKTAGKASLSDRRDDEVKYEFDPNAITFEGKRYTPRNDLTTFLFMGVDTGKIEYMADKWMDYWLDVITSSGERTYEEAYDDLLENLKTQGVGESFLNEELIASGQADVLLLVVLDEKAKKADIISIDRNSMSYFEAFDPAGNSMGVSEAQLCLAYSYGDGAHDSCKKTVSAVSDFLYEIPIHAYYSMKYMAIREVNDAVGGVEVEIKDDMTVVDERLVLGERVLLDGELAEKYLTARQNVGNGSNEERLSRHKEYIMSFIGSAVKAVKKDLGLPFELYNKIADNSVTDLSVDEIVYLATLATELEISFHSIDGTTDTSGSLDEFRPDEDALWQMILDTFYICEE
ncbi:MAG: LCP family protein [Clostridia bacterium]|nr:LCP family protein [Clostridia bacterium]